MIKIAKTLSELADSIVYLRMNSGVSGQRSEFQTNEEGWESLGLSLDHLGDQLGEAKYAQLVDMAAQAKAHYDAEAKDKQQGFLGSWLMQDIEWAIRGRSPFAYPKKLYRWPRSQETTGSAVSDFRHEQASAFAREGIRHLALSRGDDIEAFLANMK